MGFILFAEMQNIFMNQIKCVQSIYGSLHITQRKNFQAAVNLNQPGYHDCLLISAASITTKLYLNVLSLSVMFPFKEEVYVIQLYNALHIIFMHYIMHVSLASLWSEV